MIRAEHGPGEILTLDPNALHPHKRPLADPHIDRPPRHGHRGGATPSWHGKEGNVDDGYRITATTTLTGHPERSVDDVKDGILREP